ncbi:MAG: RagB/SusD family nutrient uptake outer membrane protein [Mediterranea sp.]|nr:RagB/SusD family nutrient uptake outer membrane protein [Mediterranea sp.]
MNIKNTFYKLSMISAAVLISSCGDDYLETSPTHVLEEEAVTETMQKDPSQVQAYVTGAYLNLYCGGDYWVAHDDFGLPAIKLATDLLCDDIAYNRDVHFFCYDYQLDNRMGNYRRTGSTWNQLYQVVDNANTIITMLKPAEGEAVADATAQTMLGEAYSLRAYAYFWLVNLWQHPYSAAKDKPGVPLKTDTEYIQKRVNVGEIYEQILADIDAGYNYLEGKGFHNSKIGLSEYAAAAIYANILLFVGDNTNAAKYAEIAAKSAPLNSEAEMLSGFNSLSMSEVIWGYNVNSETTGYYASFFSHVDSYMIGYGGKVGVRKLVASYLYDQIADEDIRKKWFGYNEEYNLHNINYGYEENLGLTKYISNKFRDISMTNPPESPFTSALIYFRSGEMYFVAAEANYLAGNEAKAREMLNSVMATRIPGYNCSLSGSALYDEICIQKRIETFEEGNRYLDVKRRGETIDRSKSVNHAVDLNNFDAVTYSAHDYRMIYHIPNSEMENNPEITEDDDND